MAGRRKVSSVVSWENPPGKGGRREVDHNAVAAELKANAGAWGKIGVYPTPSSSGSTANQIRTASLAAYRPAGSFEAMSRTADGEYRVYARYVGEEQEYA